MNETINLMKARLSPLCTGQISDNYVPSLMQGELHQLEEFQSYSIIVCGAKQEKKEAHSWCPKKPFGSLRPSCFVSDLNRAQKGVHMHTEVFYPEGTENLLISSVDAALAEAKSSLSS